MKGSIGEWSFSPSISFPSRRRGQSTPKLPDIQNLMQVVWGVDFGHDKQQRVDDNFPDGMADQVMSRVLRHFDHIISGAACVTSIQASIVG